MSAAPLTQSPGYRPALSLLSSSLYPRLLTLLANMTRKFDGLIEGPEVSWPSQRNTNIRTLPWRQVGEILGPNFFLNDLNRS